MKTVILAATTLLALASIPTKAATIPDGCYPAVQNWVNGSGYTCPIMGGSAVESQAPTIITPETSATVVEAETVSCGAIDLKGQVLPPALRNRTMSDAIAQIAIDPCAK